MPIRTLLDLVRSGATSTAAYFASIGRGIRELTASLQRRYGSEFQAGPRTVRALDTFGRQATAAGQGYQQGQPPPPPNVVPTVGPPAGREYRYNVDYSIQNRNPKGQLTTDIAYHTFQYNFGHVLSYEELAAMVAEDVNDLEESGYGRIGFILHNGLFNQPLKRMKVTLLYGVS